MNIISCIFQHKKWEILNWKSLKNLFFFNVIRRKFSEYFRNRYHNHSNTKIQKNRIQKTFSFENKVEGSGETKKIASSLRHSDLIQVLTRTDFHHKNIYKKWEKRISSKKKSFTVMQTSSQSKSKKKLTRNCLKWGQTPVGVVGGGAAIKANFVNRNERSVWLKSLIWNEFEWLSSHRWEI